MSKRLSGSRACPFVGALVLLMGLLASAVAANPNRIQPFADNPSYWAYKGEPVLLLGASRTHNLFQSANIAQELDIIRSFGGNYIRNTMSIREADDIFPYVRGEDGFDFDRFNPEYWEKFEQLLREAAARDIVVQVEIWDIWDFHREAWLKNPFNPSNARPGEGAVAELPASMSVHPDKSPSLFFSTVEQPMRFDRLLAIQTAFIRKLLSISLGYPNVLYCIDNESFVTPAWALHWVGVIRAEAAQRDVQVELTEMWEPWNIRDPKHLNTIDHPETYSFIDASQNSHIAGQRHYDNAVYVVDRIRAQPRPVNNTKIYGSDTSKFVDEDVAISSFWKSLFAGHAAVRFHRRPSGLGTSELARNSVRVAREVFAEFDFAGSGRCTDELGEREEDEAYCLRAGSQLLVYFPKIKADFNFNTWRYLDRRYNLSSLLVESASVTLPALAMSELRWYNIESGAMVVREPPAISKKIVPPNNGHWLLFVR